MNVEETKVPVGDLILSLAVFALFVLGSVGGAASGLITGNGWSWVSSAFFAVGSWLQGMLVVIKARLMVYGARIDEIDRHLSSLERIGKELRRS
jgi:hypothetical protein